MHRIGAHKNRVRPTALRATVATALAMLLVSLTLGSVEGSVSRHSADSARPSEVGFTAPSDRMKHPLAHAAAATVEAQSTDSLPAPTVILYGDSLAAESQSYFQDALVASGISDVHTNTFGGTAVCDWLDQMREDAGALHPSAVVIEFSGNAFTPCMHDQNDAPLTDGAYYAKYLDDATEALTIFAPTDARVYFVGTPLSQHSAETHDPNAGRLNALYALLATFGTSQYVDAGAAVLDHGEWTQTLPCLPNEPCSEATGRLDNVVRAADGMHFCPASPAAIRGVTGDCPVWSSGAFRFGTAMAVPIIQRFGQHAANTAATL